ncbi:MAG TPA: hypothetical protein VND68_05785 [Chloroflexia bacterium]|nr:hypothetical protein [Chloroflexia bacterium]
MPDLFTNHAQAWRTAARILLPMLLTLWLVTGSSLFRYPYWNVTQADYDAALAKWDSLPVAEYEETIELWDRGKWKIVVKVDRTAGRSVENVTQFESLDDKARNVKANLDAQHFKDYWTVDAMFRGIRLLLERPDHLNPTFHGVPNHDFSEIVFDQAMGYPSTHTVSDEDSAVTLFLVDVKVLK